MRRVLVVDDDDGIREVATLALEVVGGWQISTAATGEAAWEAALTGQPDAILLDVMMPGIDGPTTLARLRDDPRTRTIPVIFLTAKSHPEFQANWSDLEVAGVIAKPFDPMTLAGDVSAMLEWT